MNTSDNVQKQLIEFFSTDTEDLKKDKALTHGRGS